MNRDLRAVEQGLAPARWLHGPAALLGGKLELTPLFSTDVGAEVMDSLGHLGDVRVNLIANAMSFIGHGFAFGTNLTVRYLREPIGDRAHVDTSLQAVLAAQHSFGL